MACWLLVLGGATAGASEPAIGEQARQDFLTRHWRIPVPPQGRPPARFTLLEASLDPESCAVCHRVQYNEWTTSLHSKSMGPGVMGQTQQLIQGEPAEALLCYGCHAPLTEQQEKIQTTRGSRLRYTENPAYLSALQAKGLACAACHVRGYETFGPPKRDGSIANSRPPHELPHNGAVRTPSFERAEFCKGCHQFDPDGYALNGKLLENTYNEWKDGPYGQQGKACQECHMPDRRHLWRGIHDPEMVRQGVTVRLALEKDRYTVGEEVWATITVTNSGVGHYFPTYLTPKVIITAMLVDAGGTHLPESLREERIGWEATIDLREELYDTRIPPGKTHTFRYRGSIDRPGLTLKASVVVNPDDFYIRFFEAVLPLAKTPGSRRLLQQAIDHARQASFVLFGEDVPLS